jgi:hypothetical protein
VVNHNHLRSHFLHCIQGAKSQHCPTVQHLLWITVEEAEVIYKLLVEHAASRGCIGYPECDGDLEATPHSAPCPKACKGCAIALENRMPCLDHPSEY